MSGTGRLALPGRIGWMLAGALGASLAGASAWAQGAFGTGDPPPADRGNETGGPPPVASFEADRDPAVPVLVALSRSIDRVGAEPDKPLNRILTELITEERAEAGLAGQGERTPAEMADRLLLSGELQNAWASVALGEVYYAANSQQDIDFPALLERVVGDARPVSPNATREEAFEEIRRRIHEPYTGPGSEGLRLDPAGPRHSRVPLADRLRIAETRLRLYWAQFARSAVRQALQSIHTLGRHAER